MKRIELEIVADNSQYIQSAKQVEQATTSMQKTVQRGQKREKGLIEDTIDAIKGYEDARKKAYRIEDVEKYNKKLAEARQTLKEYNQAGVEVEKTTTKQAKTTSNLATMFGKLIGPLLTVTAATKAFKAIVESTDKSSDAFKVTISGLKFGVSELLRTIASGDWEGLGKRMKEAMNAGRGYAEEVDNITHREIELSVREAERKKELAELAKIYRNTGLVGAEGYKKRQEAAEAYIKLAEEGEREALEVLQIRLDNELNAARVEMGISDEVYKRDKKLIDARIKDNILSAKAWDDNKEAIQNYISLQAKLDAELAKGVTTQRVNPITEQLETVPGADPQVIAKLRADIALIPEEIRQAAVAEGEFLRLSEGRIKLLGEGFANISLKQAQLTQSTIRANTMAELAGNKLAAAEEKTNTERLKQQEELTKALLALQNDYEKSQIDQLEGKDKIAAERDYQLRQVSLLRAHLESLGTLTAEHYKMLTALEDNVRKEALKKELDFEQETYDELVKHGDKVRDLERQLQEEALELLEENEEEKLKLQIKFAEEDIKRLEQSDDPLAPLLIKIAKQRIEIWGKAIDDNKDEFSIWKLFGIDPDSEEGQKMQENLQIMTDSVISSLDSIFSARVDDTQRTRELLDDQIGMTQDALEAEMDLMKEGFANNVDAKRKELEELKKQREIAIREEEKALKAQQQIESAYQAASMISAVANIFKGSSEFGPFGWVLAIAATAAMLTAFTAAKVKAAAATKLAEGGVGTETGMITGRSHAEGGESFLKHVEVERGEMFGVLNRHAARKYGKAFTEIVNNFNRDNLVIDRPDVINTVNVDVNQTNERLDKVEYQLIRLNRHFLNQADVKDLPNVRIEKRGNKTRIIRK